MDHQDQVLLVQTSHIKKVILRKMVIWFLDFCVFEHLGNVGYHGVVKPLALLRTLVCYVLGSIINFPDSPSTTDNCHTNAFSGPARPLTSNRVTVLCHIRMVCTVHSSNVEQSAQILHTAHRDGLHTSNIPGISYNLHKVRTLYRGNGLCHITRVCKVCTYHTSFYKLYISHT